MVPFDELKTQESRSKRVAAEQNGACNHCELTEWRGKPITLELEHKDGDSQNNNRDNLECICPNCHSQTPTWRGRNKSLRKKISDEEMIAKLRETGSMHQTLLSFKMAPKGANYVRTKRLVRENAITLRPSPRECHIVSLEEFNRIIALRGEGMSLRNIARTVGYNRQTVTDLLEGRTYRHFHEAMALRTASDLNRD